MRNAGREYICKDERASWVERERAPFQLTRNLMAPHVLPWGDIAQSASVSHRVVPIENDSAGSPQAFPTIFIFSRAGRYC